MATLTTLHFNNGHVTAFDPSGPFLAGHHPSFHDDRAFMYVVQEIEFTASEPLIYPAHFEATRFRLGDWVVYRYVRETKYIGLKLKMVGVWILDEPNSRFPAPPETQEQCYRLTIDESWSGDRSYLESQGLVFVESYLQLQWERVEGGNPRLPWSSPGGSISSTRREGHIRLTYAPDPKPNIPIHGSIEFRLPQPNILGLEPYIQGSFLSMGPDAGHTTEHAYPIQNLELTFRW